MDQIETSRSPTRSELLGALGLEVRRQNGTTVLFHQAIADRLGLGATEHRTLDILLLNGPRTAGELAATTGLTTGAITGVVDRLERAGFVRRERDRDDRRRVLVRPVDDPAVFASLKRLFGSIGREFALAAADYSDAELALVLGFLQRTRRLMQSETRRLRTPEAPGAEEPAEG
jgi:DNA-binding MarR family transcriptional regulator